MSSNHETNTPRSDTPRTDAFYANPPENEEAYQFARTLERELAQAKAQIENQASIIRDSCTPANVREQRMLEELAQLRQSFEEQRRNYIALSAAVTGDGTFVCEVDPLEVAKELRERANQHTELIMAVARKFDNETRHQTALRYIQHAEANCTHGPAQAKP